jgi:hypothetical protein
MDGNQGPDVALGPAAGPRDGGAFAAAAFRLAALPPATDSAGIIDRLRILEDFKSAAAAEQA